MERLLDKDVMEALLVEDVGLLEAKCGESGEEVVVEILRRYKLVLERIRGLEVVVAEDFREIRTLSRMYLETSSDYMQDFLEAMGRVEALLKWS